MIENTEYFTCGAVSYLVDTYVNSVALISATPKTRKHLEDAIISPKEVVLKSKKQVVDLK